MDSDRQIRHSQDASRHIKPLDVYKQALAGLHQESQEQIKLPDIESSLATKLVDKMSLEKKTHRPEKVKEARANFGNALKQLSGQADMLTALPADQRPKFVERARSLYYAGRDALYQAVDGFRKDKDAKRREQAWQRSKDITEEIHNMGKELEHWHQISQLQDMSLFLERFQGKVEEILTSDQRFPEAAKGDTRTFLGTQLEQMRAAKDAMNELRKTKPFGHYSETIFQDMEKLQQDLEAFTEKPEKYDITTLNTLKEKIIDLHKVVFLKGMALIFESGDVPLLIERNATHRVITEMMGIPAVREDLMKLLEIPPGISDRLLAQTALAFKCTSRYMTSKDHTASIMKKVIEGVQQDKPQILENPSKVIFLPIKYRRRGNIQEGTLQAARQTANNREHVRALVEQDLEQLQFCKGGEQEWTEWRDQSKMTLRFDLTHLKPQFQGKEVLSLERGSYDKDMLKINLKDGEAWFSYGTLDDRTFGPDLFSGDQVEQDYTAWRRRTFPENYWQNKDNDWHLTNRDYQSLYHPMIKDYADNIFHVLIDKKGKKRISILELGCGSGDLAELMLKKLQKKYPDVDVTYVMIDINKLDIEVAKERFKRLDCGQWEVRPMVKDIFAYGYNAEKALEDMEMPNKVDIVISCGGPFSPRVGGTFEETIKLVPMIAGILDQGGYILATGGSGVDPTSSDYKEKRMIVKNTYHHMINDDGTIEGLPMQVIQNPYGKRSSLLNPEKSQ